MRTETNPECNTNYYLSSTADYDSVIIYQLKLDAVSAMSQVRVPYVRSNSRLNWPELSSIRGSFFLTERESGATAASDAPALFGRYIDVFINFPT